MKRFDDWVGFICLMILVAGAIGVGFLIAYWPLITLTLIVVFYYLIFRGMREIKN